MQPLALPGRRRDSGSLTPFSRPERQSEDSVSVDSFTGGGHTSTATAGAGGGGGGSATVGGGEVAGPAMHKLFSIELRRTQIQVHKKVCCLFLVCLFSPNVSDFRPSCFFRQALLRRQGCVSRVATFCVLCRHEKVRDADDRCPPQPRFDCVLHFVDPTYIHTYRLAST